MESENACNEEPGDLEKTIELKDLNQSNPQCKCSGWKPIVSHCPRTFFIFTILCGLQVEKFLRLSSVYYILFVLIIGLPIWYASTTTYRADLPYDRIASLNANKFQYTVLLELVDLSSNFDKIGLVKLERELSDKLDARMIFFRLKIRGVSFCFYASNRQPLDLHEKGSKLQLRVYGYQKKLSWIYCNLDPFSWRFKIL